MTTSDYNRSVMEYSDGVFRFILKQLKDSERARDIVQDTWEKLWINRDTVDIQKVKSWVYTTAYHRMIDVIRVEKRMIPKDEMPDYHTTERQPSTDLNKWLHQALDLLPEIQKTVVLLRDYEGYSYQEIGEICELNESQVKVYIYRARLAMQKYLVSIETVI